MFEGLDAVPWREVRHAYGWAVDAPMWIRLLDSEDPNLRADAICDFLFSSAFHQYTLYPATPFVIPFVIEALQSPSLCARDNGIGDPIRWHLLHFVRRCAEGGQRSIPGRPHPKAPTIEEAVLSGAEVYAAHTNDREPTVAETARWLVDWCRQ